MIRTTIHQKYNPMLQTTCVQQNHLYSYQFTEHYGTPSYKLWCLCVNDAPNPEDLIDGCHDPIAETTYVTVIIPYQLVYQFVWYNCHTFTTTAPGTLVNSARDCFATCNPYSWAGVVYDQRDPNLITCRCYAYDNHPWYGTPATACLPGLWFIYNHFPQPSGAVRKRYNGFQEGNKKTEVCPKGLTACKLLDSEGLAFECIDTSQELESCGGCRYGMFMSREKEEGPSEDCTVITGAELGAVTYPDDLQTVCGLGDWFVYSETVLPSGFVAKKRLHKDEDQGLCPKGLTACRTDSALSSSFDYECINIEEELESCGGCLFGQLHVGVERFNFPIGLDCTQLPGVRADRVTCQQGECSVFSCDDDHSLHAGNCMPS
ncbi:hypothetical protein L486_07331 [Kwoniella mangroviensis CBS 10435]|uniref:Protein CPL1-like domain-containing protein n=1 Tax=Kwoniella mangroviensis CBS 10435 TaxID=1331196 RepID=A0A1B9IHQ5_9TREE|nr:hypothetical protein L486_07331 [Kwoniella mangroviensis CBS 10435]